MFTQKKMGFYIFITENSTKCSSYSCCTELASGDCQGKKKSYNPVCWLLSLAEDWTVLGLFNDIPSRVFSTLKKKKKWLSSFYGLTIYFIQMGFSLFVLQFFFFCFFFSFCFFSFLFYSINYFAHSGVFGDLIYLVTRPFPSFGKRVSCWLNWLFFTFAVCT